MLYVNEMARASTLLAAIKQNLPSTFEIGKSWVIEFHSILDEVEEATGTNLEQFRIPQADLYQEMLGGACYTGRTVVDRGRFLMTLNAVLAYFISFKD